AQEREVFGPVKPARMAAWTSKKPFRRAWSRTSQSWTLKTAHRATGAPFSLRLPEHQQPQRQRDRDDHHQWTDQLRAEADPCPRAEIAAEHLPDGHHRDRRPDDVAGADEQRQRP